MECIIGIRQINLTDVWWLPRQLWSIKNNVHILLRFLSILLSVMNVHYAELTLLTELHLHSLDSIVFDDTLATVLGRLHNFEIQCPEINQPKVSFNTPFPSLVKPPYIVSASATCNCYVLCHCTLLSAAYILSIIQEYLDRRREVCAMSRVPLRWKSLSWWISMKMSTCSPERTKESVPLRRESPLKSVSLPWILLYLLTGTCQMHRTCGYTISRLLWRLGGQPISTKPTNSLLSHGVNQSSLLVEPLNGCPVSTLGVWVTWKSI